MRSSLLTFGGTRDYLPLYDGLRNQGQVTDV
jgi:hypothetical protein